MADVSGYVEPEETAILKFEGTKWEGAEVKVLLSAPLDVYLELDLVRPIELYKPFSKVLLEWNLRGKDKKPLPANEEGLRRLSPRFINLLVREWGNAAAAVPDPLFDGSENGSTEATSLQS